MSAHSHSSAETIDTLGLTCPGPVLNASRRIRELGEGAVLDIVSDCEGAAADLLAWANATGNHLLETRQLDEHARSYRIHKGYQTDATLDGRGQRCPLPVIEAARAIGRLTAGATLRLISDCPRAPEEMNAWIEATGHELLSSVTDQNGDRNFYIRKSAPH